MARTITLDDLISAVQWQADVEGAVGRHTPLKITEALNKSILAFRGRVSEFSDFYKTKSTTLTIAAGDSTIPVIAGFIRLFGIDVLVQGKWRELFQFQFSERNQYEDAWLVAGTPTYFRERDHALIDIMPTADGAYSYRLWYLPTPSDLVDGTDTFDGIAGWEDWIIFDTALRISARDADVNDNYQYLQSEFQRTDERIMAEASRRTMPKGGRRLDTAGRRRGVDWSNRWRQNG